MKVETHLVTGVTDDERADSLSTPEQTSFLDQDLLREDNGIVYTAADTFVPDLSGFYTYADYLRMELAGRWELIKGFLREMSAPRDPHQVAVGSLFSDLMVCLKSKPGTTRVAPYDVRLFADDDSHDTTIVQPDVCVICDPSKISHNGCAGAPDLIIEVLSPGTEQHDRLTKTSLYEQAGVREYWIVDLKLERIEQRVLKAGGVYPLPSLYGRGDNVESVVVPGFRVSIHELMEEANEFEEVE